MRTPTGQRIAIDGVEQGLRDGFEQVFGGEVGFPEPFARAEELVGGCAGHDEVFGEVDAADAVEPGSRISFSSISQTDLRRHTRI